MSHFSELDLEIKRALGDAPYWKSIKPCPRCGARRSIVGFNGGFIVRCTNLECENSGVDHLKDARQNSGPGPLRAQVMSLPLGLTTRFCNAAVSPERSPDKVAGLY